MGSSIRPPVDSQSPPPPRTHSGTVPRRARVLVVDDERLVGESLRRVLADEFAVTATTDPEQALTWITTGESFDVILCDVMMPVTNGVQLRNRIDAIAPDQAARIVFVTGGIVLPEVQSLLERVPNAWLEKPIDVEGLRELIRRRMRSATWLPEAPAV
jgi:CheY-like chemotaxis protein